MSGIFIPDCTQEEIAKVLMYARTGANNCMIGVHKHYISVEDTELPRWIPISEKLPEENGRYLVTRGLNACGAMWNRAYIINYSDLMGLKSERIWWDGNVGKSDFKRFDDVIAWMPLPESYKKDGAEE